jgi:hypothetical protein
VAPRERQAESAKERVTVYLTRDLWEEARSAALELYDPPESLRSLSDLFDRALERELERLRRKYRGGRRFPLRSAGLPGGRPRQF